MDRTIEVGRILQQAFEAFRQQWLVYLILGMVLSGIPVGIFQWVTSTQLESGEFGGSALTFLAGWGLSALGGALLQSIVIRSSIDHLSGRGEAGLNLVDGLRLFFPIFVLWILTSLLSALGAIFLIVPGIIIYLMLTVSVPALIEERQSIFESMRRSRRLTEGSRNRILLLFLIFWFGYFIVFALITALGATITDELPLRDAILTAIVETCASLFTATMVASLYLELRTIKDGQSADGLTEIFA